MAARGALCPAVGKRRGGAEAAETFLGAIGPGDPKWVEGHQLFALCWDLLATGRHATPSEGALLLPSGGTT